MGRFRENVDVLIKRIVFSSQGQDLRFFHDEVEDIGVGVEVGFFGSTQKLRIFKLSLVSHLDKFVGLSEVRVFAKVVDVEFGGASIALTFLDNGPIFNGDFNDFAQTAFSDVLVFFVDGSN